MKKFTKITSVAAFLPIVNIDTDMIIPKDYLKTITRLGLGSGLFANMRYLSDGSKNPDFILNKCIWKKSKILITGKNFGCGSSREHAPWALLDFGIRCIISVSFADIFYNNCFKNSILPIILNEEDYKILISNISYEGSREITIDLEKKIIYSFNKKIIKFCIDDFRRRCLLEGLDDIDLTIENSSKKIEEFEKQNIKFYPWI